MGYLTRFQIGLKSGFDADSYGSPINSIIDSDKVFIFSINPRTQNISFGNIGNEKVLIDGSTRMIKQANSIHKKTISLSQQLMTDSKYNEFIDLIVDADEDIVLIDDNEDIYVVNLLSLDVSRRPSTKTRLVSWTYSMVFKEV